MIQAMTTLMARKENKKGFTLVELIIVIAIIAILVAVLLPRFAGFTDKAKQTQYLTYSKQIATAVDSIVTEGTTLSNATVLALAGLDPLPAGVTLQLSTVAAVEPVGAFSITIATTANPAPPVTWYFGRTTVASGVDTSKVAKLAAAVTAD